MSKENNKIRCQYCNCSFEDRFMTNNNKLEPFYIKNSIFKCVSLTLKKTICYNCFLLLLDDRKSIRNINKPIFSDSFINKFDFCHCCNCYHEKLVISEKKLISKCGSYTYQMKLCHNCAKGATYNEKIRKYIKDAAMIYLLPYFMKKYKMNNMHGEIFTDMIVSYI